MKQNVIILAAGKGSRMKSDLPKVLQPLGGRALLAHVLDTARKFSEDIHIVIGHGAESVVKYFDGMGPMQWVMQEEQLGTGHAVQQAMTQIHGEGRSLILYGDVPLVSSQTLQALLDKVSPGAMSILTVSLENPTGYGRILRDENNIIVAVIEEKDANDQQRKIHEVNTGIIAIETSRLRQLLPELKNNNKQGEYYLTDIIALCVKNNIAVESVLAQNDIEVQGVNDKKQLAMLEREYQKTLADHLMEQGVTLADPSRIDIRGEVITGMDVFIDINCVFNGRVIIGRNVIIGPNCVIGEPGKIVTIGDDTEIKANSIIEEAEIAENCVIGPYARLRPGTRLARDAKIGNFVETKKADIGQGSKVNHLTYLGDATIGKNVNVGAGTITCNYDGVNKFETVIGDNAFIGSNTSIVAPVTIEEGATIGAGSTINKNVEKEELAIARAKQRNIQGWQRPRKD